MQQHTALQQLLHSRLLPTVPPGSLAAQPTAPAACPPSAQGIELVNPNQAQQEDKPKEGTESYFSEYSGFRSLRKLGGA
jgi:hypothetical protein